VIDFSLPRRLIRVPASDLLKPVDEPLPTRASLLNAIKDPGHARWEQFVQTYRGLILGVARKSGLNEHEADEALQETLLAVAEKMPAFQYNPAEDSFKGWLLQITRWKIADQFRKRAGHAKHFAPSDEDATQLGGVPSTPFEKVWDAEWRQLHLRDALARVKRQVNPSHYAIYHLHVLEEKSAADVCATLGVNRAQLYLAKHRVGAALKKELARTQAL
jgi:RNA polymerase sigma factor (sigma-70 family)